MLRKKIVFMGAILILLVGLFSTGCGDQEFQDATKLSDLEVVTSISILADITENIIGQRGSVDYIVSTGDNPEDYELLPGEIQMVNYADVFFINGMGLEMMMEEALGNITDTPVVHVTEGIEPIPLEGDDAPDPHAWLDVKLIFSYIDNIADKLIQLDPDGENEYRENAENYKDELKELDGWIKEQVKDIPEKNRVIVVSENAYKYFGEAYGFQTEGIWELNSHEEGTPKQISRIVDLVKEKELPAVFVETTIDRRYMGTISAETGAPISGEVYTDALGSPGSGADTYIEMMEHNVKVFKEGLR